MRLITGTAAIIALFVVSGCGPRMYVVTGTTIGLHATPGDGQTRPPQVTLAYKRAETAIIPTGKATAKRDLSDAYSAFAAFSFFSKWWGDTRLDSFIATGVAAQNIVKESPDEALKAMEK